MAMMAEDVRQLRKDVLALPHSARALLAQELLESLDEETDAKAIDALWARESESRYAAVKSGKIKCVAGDEVLRRVRNRKRG